MPATVTPHHWGADRAPSPGAAWTWRLLASGRTGEDRARPLLPGGEPRRRLEQDGHRMTLCDTFRTPASNAEKHFDDDVQHSAFR